MSALAWAMIMYPIKEYLAKENEKAIEQSYPI